MSSVPSTPGCSPAALFIARMLGDSPRTAAAPDDDPRIRPLIGRVVGQALASVLADTAPLSEVSAAGENEEDDDDEEEECNPTTVFDLPVDANVPSIERFAEAIATQVPLCTDALALALVYVDRIVARGLLPVTSANLHRLFATCFVCGSKFAYDRVYSNKFYARVACMAVDELNVLELELFRLLGYNLTVTHEEWRFYGGSIASLAVARHPPPARASDAAPTALARRLSEEVSCAVAAAGIRLHFYLRVKRGDFNGDGATRTGVAGRGSGDDDEDGAGGRIADIASMFNAQTPRTSARRRSFCVLAVSARAAASCVRRVANSASQRAATRAAAAADKAPPATHARNPRRSSVRAAKRAARAPSRASQRAICAKSSAPRVRSASIATAWRAARSAPAACAAAADARASESAAAAAAAASCA